MGPSKSDQFQGLPKVIFSHLSSFLKMDGMFVSISEELLHNKYLLSKYFKRKERQTIKNSVEVIKKRGLETNAVFGHHEVTSNL